MKRLIKIFSGGLVLLFVLTVVVSGERTASDNKSPAIVKKNADTPLYVVEPAVSGEDTPQPQLTAPLTVETVKEPGPYTIPWQSINAGGEDIASANYQMMFSVGQSVIGHATSTNYEAGIGYWYGTGGAAECNCGIPGDVDNSGGVPTPLDVTFLVKKVYKSQDALYDYKNLGNCPFENGDLDGSGGSPTPLDVTFLVKKVYKSQDALCVDRCSGTPGNCPGP